jgi:hypothetical protein
MATVNWPQRVVCGLCSSAIMQLSSSASLYSRRVAIISERSPYFTQDSDVIQPIINNNINIFTLTVKWAFMFICHSARKWVFSYKRARKVKPYRLWFDHVSERGSPRLDGGRSKREAHGLELSADHGQGALLRDYADRNACLIFGPDSPTTLPYQQH